MLNLNVVSIKLSVPPIWIYIPSDAQLSPPSFSIFENVCWYGKFVFILVLSLRSVRQKWRCAMLRATESRKRCSRAGTIFKSALAPSGFLRLSVVLSEALNYFLPTPSHSMWKDRVSWKLSKCEITFSVKWSRVTWRVFIFDEQIAKKKLKKTSFPYQHTLWNIAMKGNSIVHPMMYRSI